MRISRGRVAVLAAGMCAFFDMYITQALLPELRQVFSASIAAVSLTVTATTLGVAAAAPFAGGLADRYGRKRILLIALALLSLATLGAASATDLPGLLLWRVLQGMVIPGIFTSTVAYISEEWPPAQSGSVASLYVTGTVLGGFCGRVISGLVTEAWGWRSAFFAMGLVNLMFLLLIAWLLPRSRHFTPSASLLASLSGAPALLRNASLLATYGIGFALLFALVGTFTYIDFYLVAAPFQLSTRDLSFIFFVFLLGAVVTPFSGRWALRWSPRKLGLAGLAVSAAGLLLTLGHWLPQVILGLALCSSGIFVVQSLSMTAVPRLAPAARSAAVGLYLSCYYFGGSVGATLPAPLWAWAGWHGCLLLLLTVLGAAALLVHYSWGSGSGRDVVPAALPIAADG